MLNSIANQEISPKRKQPRYRLIRRLQTGGMGEIYLAEHGPRGELVVIKVPRRESASSDGLLADILVREARALSRIRHPNVVGFRDSGRLSNGRPYLAMDYLEGEGLDKHIDRVGPIEPGIALRVAEEVSSALRAVHRAGYVFGDVKPENVMVVNGPIAGEAWTRDPWIKLIDFGAARPPRLREKHLVVSRGPVIGSAWYMPPEVVMGLPADQRADIYSLGMLLYELLAGRVPFLALEGVDVLQMQMVTPAPALSLVQPGVPEGGILDQLISDCLSKSPGERPASMDDVLARLRQARRESWTQVSPAGVDTRLESSPQLMAAR